MRYRRLSRTAKTRSERTGLCAASHVSDLPCSPCTLHNIVCRYTGNGLCIFCQKESQPCPASLAQLSADTDGPKSASPPSVSRALTYSSIPSVEDKTLSEILSSTTQSSGIEPQHVATLQRVKKRKRGTGSTRSTNRPVSMCERPGCGNVAFKAHRGPNGMILCNGCGTWWHKVRVARTGQMRALTALSLRTSVCDQNACSTEVPVQVYLK